MYSSYRIDYSCNSYSRCVNYGSGVYCGSGVYHGSGVYRGSGVCCGSGVCTYNVGIMYEFHSFGISACIFVKFLC